MSENNQTAINDAVEADRPNNFIPDLCETNTVLFMLLLTQIFALFASIISSTRSLIDWEFLGLLSIYCHTIAFTCAAITCRLKVYYVSWSAKAIVISFLAVNTAIAFLYAWMFSQVVPLQTNIDHTLFIVKSVIITSILSALAIRYFYLQHQWRLQKQSELQARLQALQSRIRPHFLFNSMNSIAGLININPNKAEDAILDLCELFRATLSKQSIMTPLREELELCKSYLNIESLRLGDRLKTEWKVAPEVQDLAIPNLSLQPLFENAVYHGIQPRIEGGKISFDAYRQKQFAYILISNPLPQKNQDAEHSGNQMALQNIKSRIQAIYGERAVLKTSVADERFNVTLRIPYED